MTEYNKENWNNINVSRSVTQTVGAPEGPIRGWPTDTTDYHTKYAFFFCTQSKPGGGGVHKSATPQTESQASQFIVLFLSPACRRENVRTQNARTFLPMKSRPYVHIS